MIRNTSHCRQRITETQMHVTINQQDKKLSYCRGTARRAVLVNSCSVSRGTEVRKVSNSKSDLQGHPRVLV